MSNIMLFGKTIQFHLTSFDDDFNSAVHTTTTTSSDHNLTSSSSSTVNLDHKIASPTTTTETETEESTEDHPTAPDITELLPPSSPFEDKLQPTTSSPNSQTESTNNTNIKQGQNSSTTSSGGGGGSQPLKKPDQILPCPRCKSTNTKFCYFNNYNVNQPRHFCRCCHRYWTAGGTMRNVPVGSGRRNNNNNPCRFWYRPAQWMKEWG